MSGIVLALKLTWRASRSITSLYVVLTMVSAVVPIATAWFVKIIIDTLTSGQVQADTLVTIGAALALTGLVAGLVPHVLQYAQKEIERRIGLFVQERLFEATDRFVGLARFEDPVFLNRLRLAQQNGGATPGIVVSMILSAGRTTVVTLGFLGSLLLLSVWMPFAVLASTFPALGAELWLARRRAEMYGDLGPVERREIFFRDLLTNVQAVKEIRLYGIGPYLRYRMTTERRKSNAAQGKLDRRELTVQGLTGMGTAGFAGAALLWSVFAAAEGRITIGDVSLLIASIAGVQAASLALMREIGRSHQQLLLFQNYREITDSEPDLCVPASPRAVLPLQCGIEFRDVWFRYSPDQPWVLRGINLTITHGEAVGLVGRNGAGKSTLIKLLCRMYDPERGAILWDGVDLRELDPIGLRDRIGAVFQDYMNYDLTAAENIVLGDLKSADDNDFIAAAAGNAGAHGFISNLPHGYNTLLSRIFFQGDQKNGAAGVTLSGGQWQRLAIARAYFRSKRDLLILDEPSSGLDAESEYEVHRGLREHRSGRTSVLISHRLGAVRDADTLVVIEEGQIVERGTHSELITTGGLYSKMFHAQARGYQSDLVEVL